MAGRKKVTISGQQYYRTQLTCPDGKRKSLYGKTIAEVREKERKFREDLNVKRANAGITVGEYAKLQLGFLAKQVAPSTYIGYEAKVRLRIIPLLGDKQLSDVTPDDIQSVLTGLTPFSKSYYRTVHMLLRHIFKAAKKNRLIAVMCCALFAVDHFVY